MSVQATVQTGTEQWRKMQVHGSSLTSDVRERTPRWWWPVLWELMEYVRQPGSQDLDRPLCFAAPNGRPCRRVVRRGRKVCRNCTVR